MADDEPSRAPAPLFLLSFRRRDELAQAAERAGWRAIAARRAEGVEQRFLRSGARLAVIDARRAFDDGLAAVRELADAVEANAAAMLVLLSRRHLDRLEAVLAAGATHYLASPFDEAELHQALRFAARHADRLAGGGHGATRRAERAAAQAETWRWRPGATAVALSLPLAARLGVAGGTAPLRRLLGPIGRDGRRAARDAVARLVAGGHATAFAHAGADGSTRVAHHLHLDEEDGSIVGRIEDVGVRVPAARDGATRDPMTGIADGPALRRWIDRELAGEHAGEAPRGVLLLIAIGRFETINSAFGVGTGDALLQSVARRIERIAGGGERCVARVAGTEFAVALGRPVTLAEGERLAGELAEALSRPFLSGGHAIALSCRIGLAAAERDTADGAALLRRASAALAEAKAAEPGAIRVLDARGEAQAARDSGLEIDLRLALAEDQIDILFQPQVAVTSGAITGVEALARWRHPRLGELGAVTLFAAAERSDYLLQLSAHVQRKALARAAAWPEALRHLRVAVNVTAADIARAGFAAGFLEMVAEAGIARGRVTVEVTESGLIEDLDRAAALLAELRAAGLRVAIDDFGTGYSSLAYLKALPLDYLKIDQHLAQDITGSDKARVVVRGVIEMARSLGLNVVAEGVETEAQLALLAAEGCTYYQGFLCAPPLDEAGLAALVGGA